MIKIFVNFPYPFLSKIIDDESYIHNNYSKNDSMVSRKRCLHH